MSDYRYAGSERSYVSSRSSFASEAIGTERHTPRSGSRPASALPSHAPSVHGTGKAASVAPSQRSASAFGRASNRPGGDAHSSRAPSEAGSRADAESAVLSHHSGSRFGRASSVGRGSAAPSRSGREIGGGSAAPSVTSSAAGGGSRAGGASATRSATPSVAAGGSRAGGSSAAPSVSPSAAAGGSRAGAGSVAPSVSPSAAGGGSRAGGGSVAPSGSPSAAAGGSRAGGGSVALSGSPSAAGGGSAAPSARHAASGSRAGGGSAAPSAPPSVNGGGSRAAAPEPEPPASNTTKPKDVVESYLRQLYGGPPAERVLAAQALGALPSFLPRSQAAGALKAAVDLGVVGSLADCLASEDEAPVQEACLLALASLLLGSTPHEDHAAPLKPPHLQQLGAMLLRPEVLEQIVYLLKTTANNRVVLAAARLVAILAPHVTQSNDVYLLDSDIVPALRAVVATNPAPPPAEEGGEEAQSESGKKGGEAGAKKGDAKKADGSGGGGGVAAPRDAAACALALLALADATPDLYRAVQTSNFFQALAVLYQRSIDPAATSALVLPADAAALLLRALTLAPSPRWAGSLPKSAARDMEVHIEECDALDCLVSYVAVEAANVRALGEAVGGVAAANARDVIDKNSAELQALQEQQRELQQQLAEAREGAEEARAALTAAEEELSVALENAAAAGAEVRVARNGGTNDQRAARRAAEAAAARAEEDVVAQRGALAEAEDAVAGLRAQLVAARRAGGPLRWQSERMARLEKVVQQWVEAYGHKGARKVRVSKPSLAMLNQVLAFLAARAKTPAAPERAATARGGGPVLPPGAPSPEHTAAVQAKLLRAGLVQAVVRLSASLAAGRELAAEVASLLSDLAMPTDMEGALGAAAGVLGKEAGALGDVNRKAALRLEQIAVEQSKLDKALRLGFPQGSPGAHVDLGPGNSLSRGVLESDVRERIESLAFEAEELARVTADAEALGVMLQGRLQAIAAAGTALKDARTRFTKAFPATAAASTPVKAPTAGASPQPPTPPGAEPSPARSLSLASQHIIAKEPSHPAGHLPGLLARALSPLTTSPSNLPTLLRQVFGRPPAAAAAAAANGGTGGTAAEWFAAVAAGGGGGAGGPLGGSLSADPSYATLDGQPSAVSLGGASRAASAAPSRQASRQASRAISTRSNGAATAATGGAVSGHGPGERTSSPRGGGGYGAGVGASGYGGGYGGFNGFKGTGPYPTDGMGRPMRYPPDSMYGIIQATHSPLRGYSHPHNGPQFALLMREKSSASLRSGGGGGGDGASATAASQLGEGGEASEEALLFPPGAMPVAEESQRVVQQAVASVLFDPITFVVFPPEPATGTAAATGGSDGRQLEKQPSSASAAGSARSGATGRRSGGGGGTGGGTSGGSGGHGGGAVAGMCVLDALLMQSELLCGVMAGLATLQAFARSGERACRSLPASVSFAALQPGALGPSMAELHRMWARAIVRQPDMRVTVAERVTEVAGRGLVPSEDFDAVYRSSGMVDALVAMLAGGLRPGGSKAAAADAPAPDDPAAGSPAPSPRGDEPAPPSPSSPGTGGPLKPRAVGRYTAIAPPTLRLGAAQQAEQAAAARALLAIADAQPDVLVAVGNDEQLLARLSGLCLDHSMSFPARLAAADLLADLLLGGGAAAEGVLRAGGYAALSEMINRDMFPFYTQDPRGGKASVVAALACLAGKEELLNAVVASEQALPLTGPEAVLSAILRSLWGVVQHVYNLYSADRTGRGRNLDPELVDALNSTAATAARELALLADTNTGARRALVEELGLTRKISVPFLQAIKDPPLYEALLELHKNLS